MPITFQCTACNTSLTVPNAYGGRKGKCPKCSHSVIAPPIKVPDGDGLSWVPAAEFDEQSQGMTVPTPPKLAAKAKKAAKSKAPTTRPTESFSAQAPLPASNEAETTKTTSGPSLTVVSEGKIKGLVYPLGNNRCSVIGRDPKNEVPIPSTAISRHHCQIERSGTDYIVSDLGSANGTLVNSELTITRKLQTGDYIQVGDTLLRFDLG